MVFSDKNAESDELREIVKQWLERAGSCPLHIDSLDKTESRRSIVILLRNNERVSQILCTVIQHSSMSDRDRFQKMGCVLAVRQEAACRHYSRMMRRTSTATYWPPISEVCLLRRVKTSYPTINTFVSMVRSRWNIAEDDQSGVSKLEDLAVTSLSHGRPRRFIPEVIQQLEGFQKESLRLSLS